jgi:hypothetical protein
LRAPQGRAAWPLKADALALEACGIVLLPEAPHRARHSRESEPRLSASLSVTTSYGRVTRSKRAARRPSTFSAGTAGSSLAMTAKERGSICQGALENGAGVVVKMVGDDTPADLSLS